MASNSLSEVPVSQLGARQSLPVPIELLRNIVLGHLATSFLSLIVEPGLDKEWDPLSPLLHSSFQLREIATSFLREILGETHFKGQSTRASVKTYKLFLFELKRLKTLAETDDATVLLELDFMFAATMEGLHECDSPILWLARECAMRTLYLRMPELCPTIDQDQKHKLSQYSKYVLTAQSIVMVPLSDVPAVSGSVYMALFRPAREYTLSLVVLSKKATALWFLSRDIIDIMHHARIYWSIMEDVPAQVDGLIEEFAETRRDLLNDSLHTAEVLGFDVEGLSLRRETLEAIRFREALESLRPLPGNALMLECCRRLRDYMLLQLPRAQREEYLAVCSLEPLEPTMTLKAIGDIFMVVPARLA